MVGERPESRGRALGVAASRSRRQAGLAVDDRPRRSDPRRAEPRACRGIGFARARTCSSEPIDRSTLGQNLSDLVAAVALASTARGLLHRSGFFPVMVGMFRDRSNIISVKNGENRSRVVCSAIPIPGMMRRSPSRWHRATLKLIRSRTLFVEDFESIERLRHDGSALGSLAISLHPRIVDVVRSGFGAFVFLMQCFRKHGRSCEPRRLAQRQLRRGFEQIPVQ